MLNLDGERVEDSTKFNSEKIENVHNLSFEGIRTLLFNLFR